MSNFSQEELDKFNKIAETWWDPDGPMMPLHKMNPVRLAFIQQETALAGKKVLDMGCGGGLLTEAMAQQGAIMTGIDLAENILHTAKKHAKDEGLHIDYYLTSAEDFSKKHLETFDIITCLEMLEHVPTPPTIIHACYSMLKPGGKVFFSTLNRNIKSYLLSILGAEYLLNILPKGTHDYQKFIKPSELASWIEDAKLTPLKTQGIHYNPVTKASKLCESIDVNYLMVAEK